MGREGRGRGGLSLPLTRNVEEIYSNFLSPHLCKGDKRCTVEKIIEKKYPQEFGEGGGLTGTSNDSRAFEMVFSDIYRERTTDQIARTHGQPVDCWQGIG